MHKTLVIVSFLALVLFTQNAREDQTSEQATPQLEDAVNIGEAVNVEQTLPPVAIIEENVVFEGVPKDTILVVEPVTQTEETIFIGSNIELSETSNVEESAAESDRRNTRTCGTTMHGGCGSAKYLKISASLMLVVVSLLLFL